MKFFAALFACVLWSLASGVAHAAPNEAEKFVDSVATQALSVISNAKATKPQKQARLEKIFADNVDIPWVGRFVLGRFWRPASDDQKKRYLKEYETFLIKNYTSRFADYTRGNFSILKSKEDGDGEFTVSMAMSTGEANTQPVLVDYRVRKQDGGGFKIFDVIVEGVSLITTQRAEFGAVVSDKGLDHLIGQLKTMSVTAAAKTAG